MNSAPINGDSEDIQYCKALLCVLFYLFYEFFFSHELVCMYVCKDKCLCVTDTMSSALYCSFIFWELCYAKLAEGSVAW